jgi:hypothetical protein
LIQLLISTFELFIHYVFPFQYFPLNPIEHSYKAAMNTDVKRVIEKSISASAPSAAAVALSGDRWVERCFQLQL